MAGEWGAASDNLCGAETARNDGKKEGCGDHEQNDEDYGLIPSSHFPKYRSWVSGWIYAYSID
jgi:hypothetical protein